VVPGTAVAEIISEGYFTLLSEVEGVIKEFYVMEGEYVEVDTAIIEVELADPKED
jgi:multidrug efflux pump subunit AcrA (membrane-fusion protein)